MARRGGRGSNLESSSWSSSVGELVLARAFAIGNALDACSSSACACAVNSLAGCACASHHAIRNTHAHTHMQDVTNHRHNTQQAHTQVSYLLPCAPYQHVLVQPRVGWLASSDQTTALIPAVPNISSVRKTLLQTVQSVCQSVPRSIARKATVIAAL